MNEERIYVIGTPGSSTVKIGRTVDLKKRLAEIQRMSPVPLKVLWSTPGGHDLEGRLHQHFRRSRTHGEWFSFKTNAVDLVRAAVEQQPWLQAEAEQRGRLRRPVDEDLPEKQAAISTAMSALVKALEAIDNPVERYRAIERVEGAWKDEVRGLLQRLAVEMRAERATYREIGELMGGVSAQRAHQIVQGVTPRGQRPNRNAVEAA